MSTKAISIRGAREHNLKGIDLDIPRDRLVVITGLSGSGKSSLAFDTIYAEGQRKYVESLSAYARQFLDQLQKPDYESIEGLPPTIAIEQRSASHNPRSTVATTTEIYDYLRLLFARVGQPRCWHVEESRKAGKPESRKSEKTSRSPNISGSPAVGLSGFSTCGHLIESQNATQIVDTVFALPEGTKLMVLAPLVRGKKGHHKEVFEGMARQGFVRARADGEVLDLRDLGAAGTPFTTKKQRYQAHDVEAVVDRIVIKHDEESGVRGRLADSIELSLKLADGLVIVSVQEDGAKDKRDDGEANPKSDIPNPKWIDQLYSENYACPIHPECSLSELEPRLFSFNSPHGACPACNGLGNILEFDGDLIVPDPTLSLENGAVEAWRKHGKRMNIFYNRIIRRFCRDFGVSATTPFNKLPKAIQRILLHGTSSRDETKYNSYFEGVVPNLQRRWEKTDSEWVKERLHNYLSEAPCETCGGARLKVAALNVFVERGKGAEGQRGKGGESDGRKGSASGEEDASGEGFSDPPPLREGDERRRKKTTPRKRKSAKAGKNGQSPSPQPSPSRERGRERSENKANHSPASPPNRVNIADVTAMTIEQALDFFENLQLTQEQKQIAAPILKEVNARLGFMLSVGLGYLSLNRSTGSLSGGEAQRIRLATQVGSGLVGCCYVLDEPTIGLHQRDNDRLIRTLRHLTDIGNTVIVVEHDEDTIRAADYLIDIGPGPGVHGGEIVAQGTLDEVLHDANSLTAQYLNGERTIAVPQTRRQLDHKRAIAVKGARENNLKGIDATFPLGGILCVTGVSGSGKSTLVNQILLRAAKRHLYTSRDKPGAHDRVTGLGHIDRIIEVDQSPIGRTPRSNPATYTGVFDLIRNLFTQTKEAKIRGYKPGRFSFNVKGGRCEACMGQGTKKIEMHFLPDVHVECETCRGKRYNRETLEVRYRGKNIAEVLAMTVEEALAFFDSFDNIKQLLKALNDVGLSYVQLGQASTTLSGGEAQRVKLATELGKRSTGHTLYLLDEPTTGLHFADVEKLLSVLHRLADAGNTVIVIEHNMDVIKSADWLLDLGPEGGDRGGTLVAEGTPEDVAANEESYTGQFLLHYLNVLDPAAVGQVN